MGYVVLMLGKVGHGGEGVKGVRVEGRGEGMGVVEAEVLQDRCLMSRVNGSVTSSDRQLKAERQPVSCVYNYCSWFVLHI